MSKRKHPDVIYLTPTVYGQMQWTEELPGNPETDVLYQKYVRVDGCGWHDEHTGRLDASRWGILTAVMVAFAVLYAIFGV